MVRQGLMVVAAMTLGLGTSGLAAGGPPAPRGGLVVASTRDADTRPIRLTRHPAFDFARAPSPDGTKVAFVSDRDGDDEIYVMNADGSGQRRLTAHPAWDFPLAFTADGRSVVFQSNRDGSIERYAVSLDGSGSVSRVADGPATEGGVRP